ncbi:unnamed protein product [Linum trigynum]|uniref:Gnk2-homologous domain-containing protein n=2 Tax=Linum trigynum TaxID=586398 RepID=A0AAV2CLC1_9ROSI
MGVQVGRLDARMATVMMSSLILTMINVGFHGGVIIITAALDPMCGASNEWFCSPTDFDMSNAQEIVLSKLVRSAATCEPAFTMRHQPRQPTILVAYMHSSCADASDPNCGDCLYRATQIMREYCPGKDGAQYGTEECCARYEKDKFC